MRKVLFYLLLVIALPAISQVKFDMFKFKRYGTPLIKSNWLILNMNYKITLIKRFDILSCTMLELMKKTMLFMTKLDRRQYYVLRGKDHIIQGKPTEGIITMAFGMEER